MSFRRPSEGGHQIFLYLHSAASKNIRHVINQFRRGTPFSSVTREWRVVSGWSMVHVSTTTTGFRGKTYTGCAREPALFLLFFCICLLSPSGAGCYSSHDDSLKKLPKTFYMKTSCSAAQAQHRTGCTIRMKKKDKKIRQYFFFLSGLSVLA